MRVNLWTESHFDRVCACDRDFGATVLSILMVVVGIIMEQSGLSNQQTTGDNGIKTTVCDYGLIVCCDITLNFFECGL